LAILAGCSSEQPPTPASAPDGQADAPAPNAPPAMGGSKDEEPETTLPPSQVNTDLPPGIRDGLIMKPFKGDLDAMVARRLVRIGVTFNRTYYFIDKGVQRGVSYDYGQLIEERLNAHFKTGIDNKIHVVYVPLPREQLLSALLEGRVDLVSAQVTVRPAMEKLVAFSDATRTNVNEVLVTGPGAPAIASVDALSGKDVFVRARSAHHESLVAINRTFAAAGRTPITIHEAPHDLEDDDLLEMVNAGLIPALIVDDFLAKFWKRVLPDITVHEDVAVRTGGSLAVPVRKDSPKLLAALNTFIGNYGLGTAFGNQTERKYLVSTNYVTNATSDAERRKFQELARFFQKYSEQYSLDYLLMAAQGYQESRLDQDAKSQVGAIGVMQVMPATGKELAVGDIANAEANIHAGVKYFRFMMDRYYKDEPMDELNKGLFTFASYNAGPARVRQLRREAEKQGLNPNVWFGNVEHVASERIGRETVTYVANIYKYYIAYRLAREESQRREAAKGAVRSKAKAVS
jgi:membrane-bound lytic murein transglycosylase MltF